MEDTIRGLQDKFDQAELAGHKAILSELIADDFLSIGPKGFMLTKDEWIDRHDHFKYQELNTSKMDIRTYDKTAIVRNIQRNIAEYNKQPVQVATRVSQVWVNKDDKWQLASIQFSPLAQEEQILPTSNA